MMQTRNNYRDELLNTCTVKVRRTLASQVIVFFLCFLLRRGWSTWKCMTSSCTQTLKIWSCRRTEAPFHSNSVGDSTDWLHRHCNSYSHNSSQLVLWGYILALEFRFLEDVHLVWNRFLTITRNFLSREKMNLVGIIPLSSRKTKDLIGLTFIQDKESW